MHVLEEKPHAELQLVLFLVLFLFFFQDDGTPIDPQMEVCFDFISDKDNGPKSTCYPQDENGLVFLSCSITAQIHKLSTDHKVQGR